jgi:GTP-binding protein
VKFIDETMICAAAGRGGNGIATFKTAKGQPKLGPDGGDGGNGGDVVLIGDKQLNTLSQLRYKQWYRAKHGVHGGTNAKTGACGENKIIRVPVGTVVFDSESGEQLGELLEHGQPLVVAKGGQRGLGNIHWVRSTRQAPRQCSDGKPGEQRNIRLELKLLADIGLAGFPNAGKSTLLSRVSSARPKIADYPFTTLVPNLGVIDGSIVGEYWDRDVVVADIPGLIEGASEGRGLGIQFLKHLERTRAILYVLDAFDEETKPISAYQKLRDEMSAFDIDLTSKPSVLVLNKIDLIPEMAQRQKILDELRELGHEIMTISSVTGEGITELVHRMASLAAEGAEAPEPKPEPLHLRPLPDIGELRSH